ncbi:MAG: SulP family inorganic anion transporter [Gammaproteobacteria bacterium]|nr:SulP family inorganic anion transporter [Gammaproteobacteria bacterium]
MQSFIQNLFPFLRWFPMSRDGIRADLVAGITVALVLVPQSMAYAQLAGLPVVYGLYASFVPVIVASLWGSSSQLHTGPVAMLSLMSAAALIPFASPGSDYFIQLAIMLAMMVGVLRLLLGLFRLGAIVNLLSSPVIIGFTNAAALIIGLSQLSKVLGVPFPRTESYLADLWRVLEQIPQLHWPTVLFAVGAWVLISVLRRTMPSLPGILIAVVLSTVISALTGYEDKAAVDLSQIQDTKAVSLIQNYADSQSRISSLTDGIADLGQRATRLENEGSLQSIKQAASLRAEQSVYEHELKVLKKENTQRRVALHALKMESNNASDDEGRLFYALGNLPASASGDGSTWRFSGVKGEQIILASGGAVVGDIPEGLPSFNTPTVEWSLVLALLPAALVMALIGFMEATSISKAIATSTGERVDTSKELIGQGLANIAGSFFGSYTVSGSFSRSAVAAKSGAKTGLFAIISAVAVVLVLLFFTSYLYHLPQAVLAVIVMMAVFSLIRISPLIMAWRVDRIGVTIGIITFFATLLMAPAIANGILLGVVLTVLHFLIQGMRPRAEILSRKQDGTLGGIEAHGLEPMSDLFVPVRFDGSLSFINVAYFEDIILEAKSEFPKAKAILVVGSGINHIDSSGEEKVREIAERLSEDGVRLMFSSLKYQVWQAFESSGLVKEMGEDAFFSDKERALSTLAERFGGDISKA